MKLFHKEKDILVVYFTAGYPNLKDTTSIIKALDKEGVDLIEVGMPYSDPLADGTTIQETSKIALENGMNIALLFEQLASIKGEIQTPLFIMGYFNQFLQFGAEKFLIECKEVGVSGLILPDLPVEIYETKYKNLFAQHNIKISFLVTPKTEDNRIKKLSDASNGFLYIVSSASTTGSKQEITEGQIDYFFKIKQMNLPNIQLIGFGISNQQTFSKACEYANGAIIGSSFLKALKGENIEKEVSDYIQNIRKK